MLNQRDRAMANVLAFAFALVAGIVFIVFLY